MQHDIESVLDVLAEADVPSSKIYTAADIHKDPHYAAREMIEHHELGDGQPIDIPGVVPKLSETPGGTRWLGPDLGQHTSEILQEMGKSEMEIEALKEKGVI